MQIRPATPADLDKLRDIDAIIESTHYLFLERSGEGVASGWRVEPRPLREKLIESNPIVPEHLFVVRQIVSGADDGVVLVAEHDGQIAAMMCAQPDSTHQTMRVVDVRVDYDFRRQGLGTVMIYQLIEQARQRELRAVAAETRTNNFPANEFFQKLAFQLAGLDTARYTNHDLVKESATLFWYAALD